MSWGSNTTPPHTMTTSDREAFLGWADHQGFYTYGDVDALLAGFGRSWAQWVNHCEMHGIPNAHQAKPLLDWLGA